MFDARYNIVQDTNKEIWDLHRTSNIQNSCNCSGMFRTIYIFQRTSRTSQASQNDDSFSSRYPHPKAKLYMGDKHGYRYVSLCCHGRNFAVRNGLSATDQSNDMQFKKIYSAFQPRRIHDVERLGA